MVLVVKLGKKKKKAADKRPDPFSPERVPAGRIPPDAGHMSGRDNNSPEGMGYYDSHSSIRGEY